jgi:flagellar protein FlaF
MAYGAPGTPVRSERSTEYDLFARITRRLREAFAKGKPGRMDLARALHDNQRLWTTLAVDVADDGNGLPRDLRARLFYLAEFTRVHSSKVLSDDASAEVLIDINTAVMRGLAARRDGAG